MCIYYNLIIIYIYIIIRLIPKCFGISYCPYCLLSLLSLLSQLSYTVIVHLTFPSPHSHQKISPLPLSFRKYIVTLPHGGLRQEEQAILMRTILQ